MAVSSRFAVLVVALTGASQMPSVMPAALARPSAQARPPASRPTDIVRPAATVIVRAADVSTDEHLFAPTRRAVFFRPVAPALARGKLGPKLRT